MRLKLTILILLFLGNKLFAAGSMSIRDVLKIGYEQNPNILSIQKELEAEKSLTKSSATPEDPMIGVSDLDRGMKTQYITITQRFRFPTKYYLQAKLQNDRAQALAAQLELKQLELREKIITNYFAIYTIQKIKDLTKVNMQAVREFARVAEKKYASGQSAQTDSMKAHFELTQQELDLIRLEKEEKTIQSALKALIGDPNAADFQLGNSKIEPPVFENSKVKQAIPELLSQIQQNSPKIKKQSKDLNEVSRKASLAKWEFAPDIQIQYQQQISGEPEDSKIVSLGVTFPLWFWKKGSEASAANSRKIAQEFKFSDTLQSSLSKAQQLISEVQASSKILKIYETSLIPQAQSAYNSSRGAYRANKTSFLDLLDSERSLYKVKTGFFNELSRYVKSLAELETELGFSVSNLENISEERK